jgi:hypothetical protein
MLTWCGSTGARLVTAIAIAVFATTNAAIVRAQGGVAEETEATGLALPPPPDRGPSWWELEVGALAVVPIERSAICPANRDCVMNAGVGLGTRLTHRSPDGVGWGLAYDLWVLDSASLYEVALLHSLRGHVRYVLDASSRVQPWIGGSVGLLLFGDASSVATGGGVVSGGAGVHVELTTEFSIFASAEAWLFATAPFGTRDGTTRADPFGVNLVLEVAVGVMVRFGAVERL